MIEAETRVCKKCEQTKTETEFRRSRGRPRTACRACDSKYNKEYRASNKDYFATYMKRYREEKAGDLVTWKKKYYSITSGKQKDYQRKYYQEHRDRYLALKKEYRKKHRDEILLKGKMNRKLAPLWYANRLLKAPSGVTYPLDLLKAKQMQMRLKHLLKEMQ